MSTITQAARNFPPIEAEVEPAPKPVILTGDTDITYDQSLIETEGKGVTFEAGATATVSNEVTNEDGQITYDASIDTTAYVEGGVKLPHGGVTVGATYGASASYSVTLPATAADTPPGTVNPYDPSSMPAGSSITIDQSASTGTSLGAALGPLFVSVGGGNSNGGSVQIEALGDNKVQVTAGPTTGIDASMEAGVNIADVVSGSVGSGYTIEQGNYQTATFDLNSPEGQAAYNAFLITGEMPADNGAGISDVASIYSGSSSHSTTASLSIADKVTIGYSEENSSTNVVETTYPDGRVESQSTFTTNGENGMTTTVNQTFVPQQDYPGGPTYMSEDMSQRTYEVQMDIPATPDGESQAQQLNLALTGDPNPDPPVAVAGSSVTLTFTHEQVQELTTSAQSANTVDEQGNVTYRLDDVVKDPNVHTMDALAPPQQVFFNVFDGNAAQAVTELAVISTAGNGGTIDCEVEVTKE